MTLASQCYYGNRDGWEVLHRLLLWWQVLKYELQETRKSQESFRDLYVRQRRENEDLKVIPQGCERRV